MRNRHYYAILLIGVVLTSTAQAGSDSFETAISIFQKGFKECVSAHGMRNTNIATAKLMYNKYIQYKEEAVAIDPSILTTAQRDMPNNLRYCEKAQVNILRAEAEPILLTGLQACEEAKDALGLEDFENAQQHISIYSQHHQSSISITNSILDSFSLASKVRGCDRLQTKIIQAQQDYQLEQLESTLALEQLQLSNLQCNEAHTLATAATIQAPHFEAIQASLNKSDEHITTAKSYNAAATALLSHPSRDSSLQIMNALKKVSQCHQIVADKIETIKSKHNGIVKTILSAANAIEKSVQTCQSGLKLGQSDTPNYEQLDKSISFLNAAAAQRKTSQKKPGANLASLYSDWDISINYSSRVNKALQCESDLATLIKSHTIAKNKMLAKTKKQEEKAKLENASIAGEANFRSENKTADSKNKITVAPVETNSLNAKNDERKSTTLSPIQNVRIEKSRLPVQKSWTALVTEDGTTNDANNQHIKETETNIQKKQARGSWTDLVKADAIVVTDEEIEAEDDNIDELTNEGQGSSITKTPWSGIFVKNN